MLQSLKITLFLEQTVNNRFRATSLIPSGFVAEARSREDVLQRLRDMILTQFSKGEVVIMDVPLPGEEHPWRKFRGIWKDNPDADEVVRNMQEYRRQVDADPNRP